MSRALELRESARHAFEELCNEMEEVWIGPKEAAEVLANHPLNLLKNFNSYDKFERRMTDYYSALNGL